MIIDWFRKKMGYHVCEEFTQWETIMAEYERPARISEPTFLTTGVVPYTKRWQERKCTICGCVFQRNL